ncbi:hypothetical protein V3W47_02680 [Deinococcus sp. YIM 134068]|uniref:hypothetical protein n=1 Tax=Deinococcus lichenicola TaxID=3118910 RepID=UPI002F91D4FC
MHPTRPRRLPLLWLGLLGLASPAAAQTVTYALPGPGTYTCAVVVQLPFMWANPVTGGMQPGVAPRAVQSPLGSLVLEPGGRYLITSTKDRGTYRASPDGTLRFGGVLGAKEYTSRFTAKDGAWVVSVSYREKPNSTDMTSYCELKSARAQMTVKGSVNPGIAGRLVYTHGGHVHALDVASGRTTPLAEGTLGHTARNGELIYQNAAGQLIVTTRQGQVALKLEPDASGRKLAYGLDSFIKVRREDLALSPDGKFLVYSVSDTDNGYRVLLRTRAGKEVRSFKGYTSANFTPDGRLLLVGYPKEGGPSGIYGTDKSFGNLRRLDPNLDFPNTPGVSPDGRRLAFTQGGKLWVMNMDGTGAKVLPTSNAKIPNAVILGWPTWSPDGRWIAVTANIDGLSTNGTEILAVPASGDASGLQFLANSKVEFVHTSGDRLSWR